MGRRSDDVGIRVLLDTRDDPFACKGRAGRRTGRRLQRIRARIRRLSQST
jgi:hypothetical protein